MKTTVRLKIAGIIIGIYSSFPLKKLSVKEEQSFNRLSSFLYDGNGRCDIAIKVNLVDKFPRIRGARNIFMVRSQYRHSHTWQLLRRGGTYIYKSPSENEKQVMLVNKTFDKVIVYLFPPGGVKLIPSRERNKPTWHFSDIVYDFLQVLLINYFALHKKGIFVHSMGVKDWDGKGFLFAGKSGAGKSTLAKIWNNCEDVAVLNDDRIIVRRLKNKFFIYSSPWQGQFNDYALSTIEAVDLEQLFFIHHYHKNKASDVSQKDAFKLLYTTIFPAFWDKECLKNIASFTWEMVRNITPYRLGFINDKRVIDFVRNLDLKAW